MAIKAVFIGVSKHQDSSIAGRGHPARLRRCRDPAADEATGMTPARRANPSMDGWVSSLPMSQDTL